MTRLGNPPPTFDTAAEQRAYDAGVADGYTEGILDLIPSAARDFAAALLPSAHDLYSAVSKEEVMGLAFKHAEEFAEAALARRK